MILRHPTIFIQNETKLIKIVYKIKSRVRRQTFGQIRPPIAQETNSNKTSTKKKFKDQQLDF